MKNATIIARFLLGLIFVVFSLNFWLHFIPMPPAQGPAGAFIGAMYASGYLAMVKGFELLGGLLVWSGRFTAAGLLILTPIILNILSFDFFLVKAFNPLSALAAVLALFLLLTERAKFRVFF
jgi:hypothetical protein